MPSPAEIEAQIAAARVARAEAIAAMMRSVAHWLAHPHFAHRTA
jgi:hypothetical protein